MFNFLVSEGYSFPYKSSNNKYGVHTVALHDVHIINN